MPIPKSGCGAAPFVNGKFYIFGGETGDHPNAVDGVFSDVSVFDPVTEVWSTSTPLPIGVHGMYPIADMVRQQIVIVAGSTRKGDAFTDAVQIFKQVPSNEPEATVYVEKDHMVIMEAEKGLKVGDRNGKWEVQNSATGFAGAGYIKWTGQDYFKRTGNGLIEYDILITNPGLYILSLHNFYDHPDSSEGNDVWVRMADTLTVDGSGWEKAFSNVQYKWNMLALFHHKGEDPEFGAIKWELEAGRYTFQLSGRSSGFSIDRIHLHNYGQGAKNPNTPPSDMIAPEHIATMNAQQPSEQTPFDSGVSGSDTAWNGAGAFTSYKGLNSDGTGCCRFADGSSGDEHAYTLFAEAKTAPECEYLCTLSSTCVAYEVSSWEGCEIHTVIPTSATTETGCTCKEKVYDESELASGTETSEPEASTVQSTTPKSISTQAPSTQVPATKATTMAASLLEESPKSETVCLEVGMKEAMLLRCPTQGHRITEVKYANYGRASGACGQYAEAAACPYVDEHVRIVEKACLGKTECGLEAVPKIFGKPCTGKKYLRVIVTCEEQAAKEDLANCEPFGHYAPVQIGTKFKYAAKDVIEKHTKTDKTITSCAALCVDAVVKRGVDCKGISVNGKTGTCFLLGTAGRARQVKHASYITLVRMPGCPNGNGAPPPAPPAPAPAPDKEAFTFEALGERGEGCCRFNDGGPGAAAIGPFKLYPKTRNAAKCETFCRKNDDCAGFEVSKTKGCAVHTIVPTGVTDEIGCTCKRKIVLQGSEMLGTLLPSTSDEKLVASTTKAAATTIGGPCLSWCESNKEMWAQKCIWKRSCIGCSQCSKEPSPEQAVSPTEPTAVSISAARTATTTKSTSSTSTRTTTSCTTTTKTTTTVTTTISETTAKSCKESGHMWEDRVLMMSPRKNSIILERDASGTATYESCMLQCITARMNGHVCSAATFISRGNICVLLNSRDTYMLKSNIYAKTLFWLPGCPAESRLVFSSC